MDIEKAKNRCNELVKVEHANWIGISNQETIQVVLNELDKKDKIIELMANELEEITGSCPLDRYDYQFEEKCENCENTGAGCFIDYFTKKVEGK